MPKGIKGFQLGNKVRKKAPHTIAAAKAREFVIKKVNENLEPLLNAKLDLALGHKKLHITPTGEEEVYTESPDGNAIQYLLNQDIGKPKETVEHQGDITLKIDV